MKRVLLTILVAAILTISGNAQSPEKIVAEYLPEGSKLMHKILEGNFGSADKSMLVLYSEESPAMSYMGMVLVPEKNKYRTVALPQPEFTWSMEEPKAAFFEDVDRDGEKELLIIGECYTGIGPEGARAFYRTRVYDRVDDKFIHLESLSRNIGNLQTAAAVRKDLPEAIKKGDDFETLDVKALNKKLDAATSMKTPLQVISVLVREFDEMRSRNVHIESEYVEQPDNLKIVITDDGYADDSVRGSRYKFALKKNGDGVWRVTSATKAWRCRQGRGHQDFSNKLCL